MAAPKGHPRYGGRVKGSVSEKQKVFNTVRDSVLAAYQELQNDPKANIISWGRTNPKDFYMIASKLIPTEISGINGKAIEMKQTIDLSKLPDDILKALYDASADKD